MLDKICCLMTFNKAFILNFKNIAILLFFAILMWKRATVVC